MDSLADLAREAMRYPRGRTGLDYDTWLAGKNAWRDFRQATQPLPVLELLADRDRLQAALDRHRVYVWNAASLLYDALESQRLWEARALEWWEQLNSWIGQPSDDG